MKIKKHNYLFLTLIVIAIFLITLLRVTKMKTIWNQNDEFGVWQGAAWVLGLDWSEVSSTNAFYGQGYGYLLAPFLYFGGNNPIRVTRVAIVFQAFIHAISGFIIYYCLGKLFPELNEKNKYIVILVSLLNIADIYYIYYFFSECILRFIVWCYIGIVVNYYQKPKMYKLLFLLALSFYSFSIHQRCILLVILTFLIGMYEIFFKYKKKCVDKIIIFLGCSVLLYLIIYKFTQDNYLLNMYNSLTGEEVGNNLLANRNILDIIFDKLLNLSKFKSIFFVMCGMIFYINAKDFGLTFWGIKLSYTYFKNHKIIEQRDKEIPIVIIALMFIFSVVLTILHVGSSFNYSRMDQLFYGRYCSYTFSPMIMLGTVMLMKSSVKEIKANICILNIIFVLCGYIALAVINLYNITEKFAFHNSCVGIVDKFYNDTPQNAILYYILIGSIGLFIPLVIKLILSSNIKVNNVIAIIMLFCCVYSWIDTAYYEIDYTNNMKEKIVNCNNDLTDILKSENEFVVYKCNKYGEGLIQFNNPFSKVHIISKINELEQYKDFLLITANDNEENIQIEDIYIKIYTNDLYTVWKHK